MTKTRQQIDELADAIAVCAARIDAATHQLLKYIREFDLARGWAAQRARSCAHWLSWRIGSAGELVAGSGPLLRRLGRRGRLATCRKLTPRSKPASFPTARCGQ